MKLEQSFEVDAPLEQVWSALIDVERVAPCLPGAAVTGRNEDGSYAGSFSVRIGPTSASYSGKLQMQEIDEAAHRATMRAQGSDKRGQGGAEATIVSTLHDLGGRTRVEVSTDYRITGRLARFGRGGMIEDISNKLLRQFAQSLQAQLAGGGQAPAESPAAGEDRASGAEATAAGVGAGAEAGEASAGAAAGAEEPSAGAAAGAGESSAGAAAGAEEPSAGAAAGAGESSAGAAAGAGESSAGAAAGGGEASTRAADSSTSGDGRSAGGEAPAPATSAETGAAPPPSAPTSQSAPQQAPPPTPSQPPHAAPPLDAGSLIGSVLLERIKRNPVPVAVAGAVAALALIIAARRR